VAGELAAQLSGGTGMMDGDALIEAIHDAVFEAMTSAMGSQRTGGTHKTSFSVNGREFARATYDDFVAVARERGIKLVNT